MEQKNKYSGTIRIKRLTAEQKETVTQKAKGIGVSTSYFMRSEIKRIVEKFEHLSYHSEEKSKKYDLDICGVPGPLLQKFKNIAKNLGTDSSTLLKIKIDEIRRKG